MLIKLQWKEVISEETMHQVSQQQIAYKFYFMNAARLSIGA